MEAIRWAEGGNDYPEPLPIQTLRQKERKKIREGSGVKPKPKAPRRSVEAAPSSHLPSETVQCKWADCTEQLHVDYISVEHWGRHIREHYADQQDTIQCKWEGGCGSRFHKSSIWKHIIVHEPRFKIRCPRGCGVSTRGDMMNRHLLYCQHAPGQAVNGCESEGDVGVEVGEGGEEA